MADELDESLESYPYYSSHLPSRVIMARPAIVVQGNNGIGGELSLFNTYPNGKIIQVKIGSLRLATEFVPYEGPYLAEKKLWIYVRFDGGKSDGWIMECDETTYYISPI